MLKASTWPKPRQRPQAWSTSSGVRSLVEKISPTGNVQSRIVTPKPKLMASSRKTRRCLQRQPSCGRGFLRRQCSIQCLCLTCWYVTLYSSSTFRLVQECEYADLCSLAIRWKICLAAARACLYPRLYHWRPHHQCRPFRARHNQTAKADSPREVCVCHYGNYYYGETLGALE